jgi:hypothetical protein
MVPMVVNLITAVGLYSLGDTSICMHTRDDLVMTMQKKH